MPGSGFLIFFETRFRRTLFEVSRAAHTADPAGSSARVDPSRRGLTLKQRPYRRREAELHAKTQRREEGSGFRAPCFLFEAARVECGEGVGVLSVRSRSRSSMAALVPACELGEQ